MSNSDEDYETQQAKILFKAQNKLGRSLTNSEIRKLLKIPPKKGTEIRTTHGRKPYGTINPNTGKPYEEA